jgi:deoxyadenosine/deoxycytidine kinase
MLYDSGKIEEIEYSIYLRWFDEFSENTIDGIIYIKTTPETCLERIKKRDRKGEENLSLEYLNDCHRYHEKWIGESDVPVLYLDGQPEQSNDHIVKINNFIALKSI